MRPINGRQIGNVGEEVVDHYIALFKAIEAQAPPGLPPPVATTDGVHFDRRAAPEERAALLAYLRTLEADQNNRSPPFV